MPKIDAPLTREQIEAQAADINTKLAAFHAEDERRAQEEYRRRAAAQQQWDEQFVATISRSRLNADVDQARAELDAGLADNPLVVALAGYLTALRRRSHVLQEQNAALARLGRPTAPRDAGLPTEVTATELTEFIAQAMTRIASSRVSAEMNELHARRDAAGTDTTEENR
jgi:hypothetical protein